MNRTDSITTETPSITVGSKTIPHNTVPWRSCTNRHPTTRGNSWGWIENAPGHVCWSDDGTDFTSRHASDAVRLHNQWLEDQKPLSLKLIEARETESRARAQWTERQRVADEALAALQKAADRLIELSALQRVNPQ